MSESLKEDGRPLYQWSSFRLNSQPDSDFPNGLSFAGTYAIVIGGVCKYIGQSSNVRNRLRDHIQMARYSSWWKTGWGYFREIKISVKKERRKFERLMTEKRLIVKLQPEWNNLLKGNNRNASRKNNIEIDLPE